MINMSSSPSPFIYWGQNTSTLFLRIALKDVQDRPDVGISHEEISFEGNGVGAHGESLYKFNIKPYKPIAPEKSRLRITGSEVLIDIPKREPSAADSPWPRLTKDTTKYAWIKPDFDRMDFSEDDEEELLERKRIEKEYMDKITAEIEETQEKVIADFKKNYLFSYSMFQLISISFVAVRLIYGLTFTEDYKGFEDIGTVIIISQIFSFLEVVHPLAGLVKTSFIPPLIQTCGRNLIILILVWNEPKLQDDTTTNYLLLFWSIADIVRHPFYMMSSMKIEVYPLVWLRYTMWIPLYPLGAGCEWLITWKAIPLYTESGKFSIELPNAINFSFSLTTYLYLHLVILPFGLVKLMLHMASLRRKKLGKTATIGREKKTN